MKDQATPRGFLTYIIDNYDDINWKNVTGGDRIQSIFQKNLKDSGVKFDKNNRWKKAEAHDKLFKALLNRS